MVAGISSSLNGIAMRYEDRIKAGRLGLIDSGRSSTIQALLNLGAAHSRGEYLIFLAVDVEILTPDWIKGLLEHAVRMDVGCAGAKLYYPD